MRVIVFGLLLATVPATALAQFKDQTGDKGPKLDREITERIQVGEIVSATGGSLQRVVATAPVPTDWPEQRVKIVNEDISAVVKSVTYRTIRGGGGLKQMVVEIPQLSSGQEAKALITFEVARNALVAPADTSFYRIPKKLDRQMLINIGPSPYIESRHPKIVAAAKEAIEDKETDWQKVAAIYDWAREHVVYKNSELKGAARALHDKEGGADELTSLFIAMCRVHKIPARTVFVLGHCYAEFYLDDDEGQGHWFPCQPAGTRSFGAIDEQRPILQKGDNYKNPENPKERLRYVTEYFSAAGRGGKPSVKFVSELVAN
ncbi:MAG: transglutaminase domain-containing protein [Planctomycetia bacterium]|nr:transglutaminase domain-containing protein [Planctomycetia bacterium]